MLALGLSEEIEGGLMELVVVLSSLVDIAQQMVLSRASY